MLDFLNNDIIHLITPDCNLPFFFQNHEKALSLMNKLLSQVVAVAPSPQSTRDRLSSMAISMAERYRK